MQIYKKKILLLGISFFTIGSFLFLVFAYKDTLDTSRTHIVTLRENVFYPAQIIIQTGDSVVFKTVNSEYFWPASNPHPTHNYYPDTFDPKRPISPEESWQMTFQYAGTWQYHDHLHPTLKGEITILPKNRIENIPCKKDAGECFEKLIEKTVSEKGIAAAYAVFSESYAKRELPRSCHWTAHQIGEEAYALFKQGKQFPITDETSYCGYGFYHGFMESLLRENPDIEYALSFCREVEKQLGLLGLQNCYHGIGHGFTEDPPDPRVWGNFEAMIAPGIETCEYLFKNLFINLNLCLTGVFTVPAGFAEKNEYGLSLNPEDPFAICRTQPYRYQKACYGEIAPKLDSILKGDFAQFPKYLFGITDENIRNLIIWVTPSVMVARDILKDDYSEFIEVCRAYFIGNERKICWGGVLLGFFTHGEPEKQYKKGISFCESLFLGAQEKNFCYKELFHRMYTEYKIEHIQKICEEEVPIRYLKQCFSKNQLSIYKDPEFK